MIRRNIFFHSFAPALIACLAATGSNAFADENAQFLPRLSGSGYTFEDAANANLVASAEAGSLSVTSALALKGIQATGVKVLHESSSVPTRLTDKTIQNVMTAARSSLGARSGIGPNGGAIVEITYDKGQVARFIAVDNVEEFAKRLQSGAPTLNAAAGPLAGAQVKEGQLLSSHDASSLKVLNHGMELANGAKPESASEAIRLRTTTFESLAEQLEKIKASGATVSKITLRSFTSRLAEKALAGGALTGAVISVERLGAAAWERYLQNPKADYCQPMEHCQNPGKLKNILSAGPADAQQKLNLSGSNTAR